MLQLFGNIAIDWLGKRKLFFGISTALILLGAGSVMVNGFRYGVDFKGGTVVNVRFQEPPQLDRIREVLRDGGAANSQIQQLMSGQNEVVIEFEAEEGIADASAGREKITSALNAAFADSFEIRSFDSVGPKVGADLRRQAIFATIYALGGILVYIAFRFEWIYGAAAVFAVFHDTLVTLGLFSLFGREINLTVIAALLTLVGYSVNDTIVIFDRVRENLKTRRRGDFETTLNDSINQTLSRTILTSGLTFFAVFALFVFGGEVINNFAFAMVIGVVVGTYSSLAIAAPMVLIYQNYRGAQGAQAVSGAKVPRPAKVKS